MPTVREDGHTAAAATATPESSDDAVEEQLPLLDETHDEDDPGLAADPAALAAEIHVANTGEKVVCITLVTAQTLLRLCQSATSPSSAAQFQLAIAQRELEQGLLALSPSATNRTLNRADRRRIIRNGTPRS